MADLNNAAEIETQIQEAGALFNEIALLCHSVVGISNELISLGDNEIVHQLVSLRELSTRIGWLSDVGANKIGASEGVHAKPIDWLLPHGVTAEGVHHG